MAAHVIEFCNPRKLIITRGTPYHTGEAESWEDLVYQFIKKKNNIDLYKIGDHEWVDINGVVFDFKHHIGRSTIPHGRHTALSRDQLWNLIWAEAGEQPKADWTVRSHVHYCVGNFQFIGNKCKWGIITPALQAMGSRYGARYCSNTVHYGIVTWDITSKGNCNWQPIVAEIESQQAQAVVV